MEIHPYTQCKIDINKFEKRIKKGGFGSVYLVREKETDQLYAAKVVDCDDSVEQCQKLIDREIGIMMLANHPTIIKFISFSLQDFQGENNVTIIMEFASKGSLADVLNKIQNFDGPQDYSNTTRQKILIGVARGMKYLHDRNIIHRDLKPGNILLDDDFHPHITDFGLSKFYEVNHSKSQSQIVGTLSYMSPEVIKGCQYGTKADVYSFGILMFEVLTDSVPYPEFEKGNLTDFDFRIKVVNESYRPKFEYSIKETLKELIENCWSNEIESRPNFGEIFEKLTNKENFIDDVDIDEVDAYVQDITEIRDPIEKLINEKDQLKNEMKKLSDMNDKLLNDNKELTELNTKLLEESKELKNTENSSNFVCDFSNKNYFIEYINTHQIKPSTNDDESLIQDIKKLSGKCEYVLGFNQPTDGDLITLNYPIFVSQYSIIGSLKQLKNSLDDQTKFIVMYCIAEGMQNLHENGIIHSNLRPEAILIDKDERPLICDFGLTKKIDFIKTENLVFVSPEAHEGKEIVLKSDVYSYSMVFYWLFAKKVPLFEETPFAIITNILNGKWPDLAFIDEDLIKDFLLKCWKVNPEDRPSFSQIVDMLSAFEFGYLYNVNL